MQKQIPCFRHLSLCVNPANLECTKIDTNLDGATRFTCCIFVTSRLLNTVVMTSLHIRPVAGNTVKPKTAFVVFNTIMIIRELCE